VSGNESRLPSSGSDWDALAPWWLETFSNGADIEYELQILPLVSKELAGRERLLDVGTGEGQIARRLFQDAPEKRAVVGLDPAAAQVRNADRQKGGPVYLRARGEALPFPARSFDAVVSCLVVEHVDDPESFLFELARVLAPGGRLVLLVNHPALQGPGSGFVDDHVLGERYWRVGPYLTEQVVVEEVDQGVPVRFSHRPLSRYVNPLCELGLVLTHLEEPAPPLQFLTDSIDLELELAMPRLCLMRFERPLSAPAGVGD
jgi:ubiquinone/menaquinone biosynthesis C-methylase UbiE